MRTIWHPLQRHLDRVLGILGLVALVGCAAETKSPPAPTATETTVAAEKHLEAITVDPPRASVDIVNGQPVTRKFRAIGHYSDGTTEIVTDSVAWWVDSPGVGVIDDAGLFTPNAEQGGAVTVTAVRGDLEATGSLAVRVRLVHNPKARGSALAANFAVAH